MISALFIFGYAPMPPDADAALSTHAGGTGPSRRPVRAAASNASGEAHVPRVNATNII